jgi:hypothetical protein
MAATHFVDCLEHGQIPRTNGQMGIRVVQLIEAATSSMRGRGETVYVDSERKAA